ncbi:MAG: SDR family NAD(P)-dependent oxidoreductase [Candidatus Omnitrophica bacterium]|nr:SDR family NAD(P)-dependent oxidoreductase [Candidatus Omnitrophota bacterium]
MSKILVTGGAGFIGSHLVDRLVQEGHAVCVLDSLEPQVHGSSGKVPDYLNQNAQFIKGDIRSLDDVRKALQGIEIVFHEAAMVGVGQSMYQIRKYVDVNTLGTANLLEVILEQRYEIQKLIVASSMSIYGEGSYRCEACGIVYPSLRTKEQMQRKDWEHHCPQCEKVIKPYTTAEDKPLDATSIYAITKKDQEEMCLTLGKSYGLPTVALRYFNVYGPRQALSNPYTGVCAIFSSRIKNNNQPIIFEDGHQSRDFINVHDIVEANLLAMTSDAMNYQTFNVGSGQPITILEVCNELCRLYGKKDLKPEIQNKFRVGDIRHCLADISKIAHVGFSPKISFQEGMEELVEWGKTVEAEDLVEQARKELAEKGLVQ